MTRPSLRLVANCVILFLLLDFHCCTFAEYLLASEFFLQNETVSMGFKSTPPVAQGANFKSLSEPVDDQNDTQKQPSLSRSKLFSLQSIVTLRRQQNITRNLTLSPDVVDSRRKRPFTLETNGSIATVQSQQDITDSLATTVEPSLFTMSTENTNLTTSGFFMFSEVIEEENFSKENQSLKSDDYYPFVASELKTESDEDEPTKSQNDTRAHGESEFPFVVSDWKAKNNFEKPMDPQNNARLHSAAEAKIGNDNPFVVASNFKSHTDFSQLSESRDDTTAQNESGTVWGNDLSIPVTEDNGTERECPDDTDTSFKRVYTVRFQNRTGSPNLFMELLRLYLVDQNGDLTLLNENSVGTCYRWVNLTLERGKFCEEGTNALEKMKVNGRVLPTFRNHFLPHFAIEDVRVDGQCGTKRSESSNGAAIAIISVCTVVFILGLAVTSAIYGWKLFSREEGVRNQRYVLRDRVPALLPGEPITPRRMGGGEPLGLDNPAFSVTLPSYRSYQG